MNRLLLILAFSMLVPFRVIPQNTPFNVGEVSLDELRTIPFPQELGAMATVLFDFATAKMIYDNGYKIEFTRHVRIKIFNSSGYSLANMQIPYTRLDRLVNLIAYTHNLENDQADRIAIGKKQFYREKIDPYHNTIRFTFPNIREGSVIEYQYTIIQNDIGGYQSMRFQRTIPVRHVEYRASVPEFFTYTIFYSQSNYIQFQQDIQKGYYHSLPTNINIYRWTGIDLPAYEPEPLMPESQEYMLGVDFVLRSVNYPGADSYVISPTYARLTDELLNANMIGHQIDNKLLFSGKVGKIISPEDSPLKKMQTVYSFIQKHLNWNGYEQLWPDKSLVKAFHTGTGTSAEINLILVNMLRTAGITADPVVLSTRENGRINLQAAMIGSLNYLVCCANINGADYLLDATDKFRPAGMLPFKCLNAQGWVLSKIHGRWVNLLNNEKYATQEYYDLVLNEKGELEGHATVAFTGYDAVNLRRLLHNEGEAGFMEKKITRAGNLLVSNVKFVDLDSLHLPLRITFDIAFSHTLRNVNRLVFFKPLISIFGDYINPWIKDERMFPIDHGCPSTEILNCRIQLPDHYDPEELPENIRIQMPDNDASFMFAASSLGNSLNIACELRIRKTFFGVEKYPAYQEFYTLINKKCNEMVILKEK